MPLRWHAVRKVAIPVGTGFERESPRPLVLRHAYQSETRRYTPRWPERTLLYRTVAENLETLLQTAREQNESGLGLPKYVEKEFRDFLRCGVLCHGFTRLVCEACGRTIFLAFSCKRRGCCSSCGARRMCNTAAVLVDRVLPEVPVRQWVLSTSYEIRLLLARNAQAFGELTRLFTEEVLEQYRRRAAKLGLANCEGGALVFQHRFGGSLNLNTHLHAVVVDGVFEKEVESDGTERTRFHALPPQHPAELTAVAYDVYRKFEMWLKKNAPALSMERMSATRDGLIVYRLRHEQKGRATHRVMRPVDFLARIAALIPPPRHPLLRYFGVFGPHSSWRKLCVPAGVNSTLTEHVASTSHSLRSVVAAPDSDKSAASQPRQPAANGAEPAAVDGTTQPSDLSGRDASPKHAASNALRPWTIDWATLLRRTYDFDVLSCPCGGRLKPVELVIEAERATELLEQFGMPSEPPPIARARSPDWD